MRIDDTMYISTDETALNISAQTELKNHKKTKKREKQKASTKEPSKFFHTPATLSDIAVVYSYYNQDMGYDDAKKFALAYFKANSSLLEKGSLKTLEKISPYAFIPYGWNCRMLTNGLPLPKRYVDRTIERMKELINGYKLTEDSETEEPELIIPTTIVVSPLVRLNRKIHSIIADIEGALDDMYAPKEGTEPVSFEPKSFYVQHDLKPAVLTAIADFYVPKARELELAIQKKDSQITEAYSVYSRKELKNRFNLFTDLIESARMVAENRKSAKKNGKTRKKREKSSDQIVKKMKFQAKDDKYNIESINPKDIVGSTQLWVFNTKTRFLGVYEAKTLMMPLTVKGTTIQDYDMDRSFQKKLRKPEDFLKDYNAWTKPSFRKAVEKIKARQKALNGRIGKDTILLKAFK